MKEGPVITTSTAPEAPAAAAAAANPSIPPIAGVWSRVGGMPLAPAFALLVVTVGLVMTVGQMGRSKEEPWRSKELAAARVRLEHEPSNEEVKKLIRDQDLTLRRSYFRALERNRLGAWLLLGGGVALVWFSRQWPGLRSPAPVRMPTASPDREPDARRARITVVVAGGVFGATFLVMGLTERTHLPRNLAALSESPAGGGSTHPGASLVPGAPAVAVSAMPSAQQWARNWPGFRGPDGSGVSSSQTVPTSWDVATGQGVVWKTNISLAGYNSPVVWEDRVFLTGGDKKSRLVFCLDASSGAIRWQRPVTPLNAPVPGVEPPEQSGAAASTVATDGHRVFAVFASGELGALDFEGHLVWNKRLDFSENGYGHASSLVVWQDRLLVQADQGRDEDNKSSLMALDVRTGEPVWTTKRPVGGSWATPLVVAAGGKTQVITAGDPLLMAHDVTSGAELWRAKVLGGELAPSPAFGNGLVIASSPGRQFTALKVDGSGDVTESHIAWKLDKEIPDVPSPIVFGGLIYTASTEGMVICRELGTGVKVWEHNFEMEMQASPMIAGERLYLFAQPGDVFVVASGREFRQLAALKMGDEVYASPAVAGDRLFVRTRKLLYCLGASAGPTQVADVR